jgi:hypothetical protein
MLRSRVDARFALCLLAACGGAAAPAPKSGNDAVGSESAGAPADHHEIKADAGKETASAASAPAAPVDEATPKAAASSGDLAAPAADDPWMAPHQMAPADVLKTMRGAMGRVNGCYHAAKKRDPSVSGDVKIKFVIAHEGAVRVWRDEASSMSDPDCTKCVGEVIQTLKFPTQRSPGDAWGIYTINFGG